MVTMVTLRGRRSFSRPDSARVATITACAVVTIVASACSAPRVVEDTAAACSNHRDDDGDDAIDCADPDCAATDACEANATTCGDGIDNDGNGHIDCEEESCRALGFCATFDAACVVAPQSGCPRGMGCYAAGAGQTSCSLGGPSTERETCTPGTDEPSEGCAIGHICGARDVCARTCASDLECPRSSFCIRASSTPFGVCSFTCVPAVGCATGFVCVAAQRIGFAFRQRGWLHLCLDESTQTGSFPPGMARRDQPCVDAVTTTTDLTLICAPGLVCVPEATGPVCREVCLASPTGKPSTGSCGEGTCFAIDPFDQRPPRTGEDYDVGLCLP